MALIKGMLHFWPFTKGAIAFPKDVTLFHHMSRNGLQTIDLHRFGGHCALPDAAVASGWSNSTF
jgi:hypothetical protein